MEKTFIVTTKIQGTASVEVSASDEEEAMTIAQYGDVEWKIDDWDLDTASYRGGFIDVMES